MSGAAPRPAVPEAAHLRALRAAADALASRAATAGLDAPVPTCPRWTAADLVAHQGIVHRWAAGNLRLDDAPVPAKREVLRVVPPAELLDWFAAGVAELEDAFATAAPDVRAMTFLKDPPAPRAFWARRQAHETTVHATDALAAVLGRRPRSDEADVAADLALDGLDELLTGFVTRGRHALCTAVAPARVAVVPHPAEAGEVGPLAWLLDVTPDGIVTSRTTPEEAEAAGADGVFRGSPAQLYLGLWNRGDEVTEDDGRGLLAAWSGNVKVSWR